MLSSKSVNGANEVFTRMRRTTNGTVKSATATAASVSRTPSRRSAA
ncbi:hypothetical protein ACFQX6_45880 [Streptosporangium lutulentum]